MKRRLPTTYQGETVLAAISLPPVTAEANRHAPTRRHPGRPAAAANAAPAAASANRPAPPGGVTAYSWPEFRSFYLVAGLVLGFAFGLVVWLVYPQSWSSFLAFVQLAASDRTPVRLMRFLEDARSRSVLRTVGPVYQFRHARLQDRLATQESAAGNGPDEPRLPTGDVAAPSVEAPPASAK